MKDAHAMLKNGLLLTGALFGFLIVLLFRVSKPAAGSSGDLRQEELVRMLAAAENERKLLQAEVDNLRGEVDAYQQDALSGKSSLRNIEEKLAQIETLAGLSAVHGPGIEVKMTDANRGAIDIGPGSLGSDAFVIHDQDLMLLINELKAAGAEALSIKSGELEERIVNSTFIRCTGPTVIVNNRKMTSPFTIRAIGDPNILAASLEMPDGLVDQLRVFGIRVEITRSQNLTIPAYTGSRILTYAQPETGSRSGK
ncbi:MAG: DUF881 domain-containing protein [bacterium]|jgi:uncharacterized protein YlxW (UPF0749 family)